MAVNAILVGCGGMSRAWLTCLADMPDAVDVAALVDIDISRAEARREEFGLEGAGCFSSLPVAIGAVNADVVFDVTVPDVHEEVVTTALAAGLHVLGEKPLAHSMAAARRMVAAASKAGKTYAVMQNRRYTRSIRRVAALVVAGSIGSVTSIHSDFFIGAHFGGFRREMEHPLLLDMAIHTFDQARCISGADPASVLAVEWSPADSWYSGNSSAVATFVMAGGIVYSYRGSWSAEGMPTSWDASWRIVGTKGSILWDGADGIVAETVAGRSGLVSDFAAVNVDAVEAAGGVGGHAGCIAEFLDAVQSGTEPETVCTENIKSLAMALAAAQSAETGSRVEVEI